MHEFLHGWIALAQFGHARLIVLGVAHGNGVGGGALKNREVSHLWGDGLNDLDAGRASAQNANPFTGEIQPFVGPPAGMKRGAFEGFKARNRR